MRNSEVAGNKHDALAYDSASAALDWGITSSDHKVLLYIGLENKESYQGWVEFFRQMIVRGLRIPLLVVSDGAPGLIKAIAECFPESRPGQCLFHKLQNIRNKIPQATIEEVLPKFRSTYYQSRPGDGQTVRRQAHRRVHRLLSFGGQVFSGRL